jgi:hypothetical protein
MQRRRRGKQRCHVAGCTITILRLEAPVDNWVSVIILERDFVIIIVFFSLQAKRKARKPLGARFLFFYFKLP